MDFYFEFRELIVNEPDIISDSEEMEAFMKVHLIDPLMNTLFIRNVHFRCDKNDEDSCGAECMAPLDTDVFRKIWLENLEVYGSREGLLRCAISTPDEFALVRSFFQDAAALEKWIRLPPEQK